MSIASFHQSGSETPPLIQSVHIYFQELQNRILSLLLQVLPFNLPAHFKVGQICGPPWVGIITPCAKCQFLQREKWEFLLFCGHLFSHFHLSHTLSILFCGKPTFSICHPAIWSHRSACSTPGPARVIYVEMRGSSMLQVNWVTFCWKILQPGPNIQKTIYLLQTYGWLIIFKKSALHPAHWLEYFRLILGKAMPNCSFPRKRLLLLVPAVRLSYQPGIMQLPSA